MNKIILSFDYEIYFDGSNRHEALLDNTNKILDCAKTNNSKLVFFIDIFYLVKLEEFSLLEHFERLKNQVKRMLLENHEIQYHLHPHWFNAVYNAEDDFWHYRQSEYSLSDIIHIYGKDYAFEKFNLGVAKMKEWFQYQPCAYRSGGLSINKNQKELIQLLVDNQFEYDSSVMPGLFLSGKYIEIDQRDSPTKDLWNIENSFLAEASPNKAQIQEIPVMTIQNAEIPFLRRVITSIQYRASSVLSATDNSNLKEVGKPFDLEIKTSIFPISITFDKSKVSDVILLKYFTKQYFTNKTIMCVLSHPKSFLNQSYNVFSVYIDWLNTHSEAYKLIGFTEIKR